MKDKIKIVTLVLVIFIASFRLFVKPHVDTSLHFFNKYNKTTIVLKETKYKLKQVDSLNNKLISHTKIEDSLITNIKLEIHKKNNYISTLLDSLEENEKNKLVIIDDTFNQYSSIPRELSFKGTMEK